MAYMQTTNKVRLFLRRWGKPALFVGSFLLVVSSPFLLNYGLRSYLENYASILNGAQVTIKDFDISLFRGTCEMSGIEVTHHTQLMRNIVEVDEVRFDFERLPLLSLKLVVPSLHVEGVHFDTARERSGVLEVDDPASLPSTALLDRIAPGVFDTV